MQWPNFGQQDVQMDRSKKCPIVYDQFFRVGTSSWKGRQRPGDLWKYVCFQTKSSFFPERNLTSTSRRKGKLSAKKISSWVKMNISGRACCSSFSLPPLNIQRCYLCALFWWMHSKEMWTFDKSSFEHSTNHLGKTKHEIIFIQQNSRHFIYVDVSPSSNLISISTAEKGKQVCQLRAMKYEEMTISQACKKLATLIKLQNELGGHKCCVRRWHGAESGWECLVLWCLSRLKSVTWGWRKNRRWNFFGFQLVFHGTDLNPAMLANLPLFQQPWCTWVMFWTFWSNFWNGQQPNIELVALAGWSASTWSLLSWKFSGWRFVPLEWVAAREPTPLSTSSSSSRCPLQRKKMGYYFSIRLN